MNIFSRLCSLNRALDARFAPPLIVMPALAAKPQAANGAWVPFGSVPLNRRYSACITHPRIIQGSSLHYIGCGSFAVVTLKSDELSDVHFVSTLLGAVPCGSACLGRRRSSKRQRSLDGNGTHSKVPPGARLRAI